MILEPKTPVSIRFQDCDPFGHLNNARYLDYFINVREDHLKQHYQISLLEFMQQGVGWVIHQHELLYLKPANVYENVQVRSSLIDFNDHSLWVEGSMWDEEEKHLKALLWTRYIHVNLKTGQKEHHLPEMLERFAKMRNETIGRDAGIKGRLAQLVPRIPA
ncbi:acyl-CoA thioester hydrolase [Catalinimonas alkaloidigena]|uniref:Acyl-CoA thioester hydrolase n=1 Tax=Catalinimonas alkaloidigena TaxID=1075417 RepID=A0A1G8XR36_9BACT|nr:acyl-CoA thioesterase [Catalinimonas alkaloidigena]SDJ92365.1 acyl-CoA thioester hydrolase [Catalinimonas alkaloidigena]